MASNLGIHWHRYAFIVELAQLVQAKSPQFGKTALQKMVYLFQEVLGIDLGYDFEFYAYGPFSSGLLMDLGQVENMGGVKIEHVLSPGGYHISPAERSQEVRSKGESFVNDTRVQTALKKLIDEFGAFSAKDLELRSSMVFIERDLRKQHQELSADLLREFVQEVKPKFSSAEIDRAIKELKDKAYIFIDSK